jgi:hypothetical protein
MGAQKFRKKPVVIEAMQYDGRNATAIGEWAEAAEWGDDFLGESLYIQTLEGKMHASKGDWIIRGIQGEFYPCKPDIFAATYEPVAS